MRCAVVDVEGNGQQPPDLVEVAVVPVAAGIIGAPAGWLVKTPRPVSCIAAGIHGLTNEALAVAPAFADIESEVREALDADVLVCRSRWYVGVRQPHLPDSESHVSPREQRQRGQGSLTRCARS